MILFIGKGTIARLLN